MDVGKKRHDTGVFIFRDSKDVLCSHYYADHKGFYSLRAFTLDVSVGLQHVIKEQNKCMEVLNNSKRHVMVFYEMLFADTTKTVERVTTSLGMSLSPLQLELVVNATSFDKSMEKERNGHHLRILPTEGVRSEYRNELFGVELMRKGSIGGWRQDLDKDLLNTVNANMKNRLNPRLLQWFLAPEVEDQ